MTEASTKMAKMTIEALEEKKAEDIRIIDISTISILGDYFIFASGNNRNQIQTMSDEVERVLGKAGYLVKQVEGYDNANWVLLDFGDIIIHLFDKENRLFYNLERIWRDGKVISKEALE
jgi:ribosome-associated protein